MLYDLVIALANAKAADDKKAIEKAYRNLERVGMDRRSADVVAKQFIKTSNK